MKEHIHKKGHSQKQKSIGTECDTRESKKGFTEVIKGYSRNTQSSYPHKRHNGH